MVSLVDIENPTREQCVFLAKLAEQTGRYEEMSEYTKKLVLSTTPAMDLTTEERNLVAVSFKNLVGSQRSAWRIINAIGLKEMSCGEEDKAAMAGAYKSILKGRLTQVCHNLVLRLLDSNLLPSATTSESRVFYLKMKGDYNRYLAEVYDGDDRKDAASITLASYLAAQEIARANLVATNPIRLGLTLNFSVFYYEILDQHDRAVELAKQDYEEAIKELDTLEEETYEDSTLIIHLLRDNLAQWTSDFQDLE